MSISGLFALLQSSDPEEKGLNVVAFVTGIYYWTKSFFLSLPENARIIWGVIFVCIGSVILLAIAVTISRLVKEYRTKQRDRIAKELKEHIYPYLFNEEDFNLGVPYQILNTSFRRGIVLDALLKLDRDLLGEVKHKIKALFFQFDLIKDSKARIRDRHWHIKIKGIQEVAQMEVDEAFDLITPFINHKNGILRKEAQLALLKLRGFEGLNFLEKLEYPLSEWQQLVWLETIQGIRSQSSFNFSHWLSSENESVISFSLKLIRVFNKTGHNEKLIDLLNHPNPKIQKEAVEVLAEISAQEAKPYIISQLETATPEMQIPLLYGLEKLGNKDDIVFAEQKLAEDNHFVRLQALKTIFSLTFEDMQVMNDLKEKMPELRDYIEHVTNPKNN